MRNRQRARDEEGLERGADVKEEAETGERERG